MLAIFMYLGFTGCFLLGITVGILVERKRAAHKKIQERIPNFPDEIVVIGNIHDKLSNCYRDDLYGHEKSLKKVGEHWSGVSVPPIESDVYIHNKWPWQE